MQSRCVNIKYTYLFKYLSKVYFFIYLSSLFIVKLYYLVKNASVVLYKMTWILSTDCYLD